LVPPFVVFWKEIGRWAYLEVLAISPPLPLSVSPEISLMTDVPSSGEVIKLLKLVHVLEFAWSDEPCPKTVPGSTL